MGLTSDRGRAAFNQGMALSLTAHRLFAEGDEGGARSARDEAIRSFSEAVAIAPRHHGALAGRGLERAQLGMVSEATADFQEAIRLAPEFHEYHRQLGLCLLENGQYEQARVQMREAVSLERHPTYRLSIAVDLCRLGELFLSRAAQQRGVDERESGLGWLRRGHESFLLAEDTVPDYPVALQALVATSLMLNQPVRKAQFPKPIGVWRSPGKDAAAVDHGGLRETSG